MTLFYIYRNIYCFIYRYLSNSRSAAREGPALSHVYTAHGGLDFLFFLSISLLMRTLSLYLLEAI